jgi:hypothetical protein
MWTIYLSASRHVVVQSTVCTSGRFRPLYNEQIKYFNTENLSQVWNPVARRQDRVALELAIGRLRSLHANIRDRSAWGSTSADRVELVFFLFPPYDIPCVGLVQCASPRGSLGRPLSLMLWMLCSVRSMYGLFVLSVCLVYSAVVASLI